MHVKNGKKLKRFEHIPCMIQSNIGNNTPDFFNKIFQLITEVDFKNIMQNNLNSYQ